MAKALWLTTIVLVAATGASAAPPDLMGVYKHRFANALISGESFTSEDVLEIVPVAPGRAYVRAELQFFNGHQCSFRGIARQEGPALVYRAPKGSDMGEGCVLRFAPKGGKLTFKDEGGQCRAASCGARGGYDGAEFPLSARRPIRYLSRLRASSEYKAALAEAGGAPSPR